MKQGTFFEEEEKEESEYTSKIVTPTYKPSNKKPHPFSLVDKTKFSKLRTEIQNSNISEEEKTFLYLAATRHLVFNYQQIADYYAHSNKEIQELMEKSALVIIDFNKAIENGYVKLNEQIAELYGKDYKEKD